MRARALDCRTEQADRLLGAMVVFADFAVWTVVVPSRALIDLLPF